MTTRARPGIMLASIAFAASALVGCGTGDSPAITASSTSAATAAKKVESPAAAPSASSTALATAPAPASTTPSATSSATDPSASPAGAGSTDGPAAGQSIVVDGKEIAGLPPGFPFPADAAVDLVIAGSMVTLTQPSAADIAAFYRTELPKARFTVDLDTGGPSALLLFSKDGWTGQIAVNSDSGATLTWGATGSTPAPPAASDTPIASGSSSTSGTVMLGNDGISNGDFNLPFPTGTELADLVDEPDKAAFSFTSPSPAEVLTFYRTALQGSTEFTVDSDETSGSAATLAWHSDDVNIVLVVDGSSARMTLTPR